MGLFTRHLFLPLLPGSATLPSSWPRTPPRPPGTPGRGQGPQDVVPEPLDGRPPRSTRIPSPRRGLGSWTSLGSWRPLPRASRWEPAAHQKTLPRAEVSPPASPQHPVPDKVPRGMGPGGNGGEWGCHRFKEAAPQMEPHLLPRPVGAQPAAEMGDGSGENPSHTGNTREGSVHSTRVRPPRRSQCPPCWRSGDTRW